MSVFIERLSAFDTNYIFLLYDRLSHTAAVVDPGALEPVQQRLNALGGFDKIVPNEGIVFVYGGNTYKLTGAFAPLNQILGIFFEK